MTIGGVELQARPLPLVVLADTSSSMASDGKIASLNQALTALVQDLRADEFTADSVQLSVITFDDEVNVRVPLSPVSQVQMPTLVAKGRTAMGAAFRQAFTLLSDENQVSKRSLMPLIVLASDGQPTDEWRSPLDELKSHRRIGKAVRIALAIGSDADVGVMEEFSSTEYPVLRADEADKIRTFFKFVTFASRTITASQGTTTGAQAVPDELLP